MNRNSEEKIINVFKFKLHNEDAWVYSVMGSEPNLYKYYTLAYEDSIPVIKDAINIIRILQNQITLDEVPQNTPEYIKFISTKQFAEKIIKLQEKEASLAKKRSEKL